jgi:CRISPR system Cascade subunit CasD
MQSWGVQSRFGVRDTGLEPSKSGVLGLVCAAMGIRREDDAALSGLTRIRMGVRVDREGLIKVDYHTAQNVLKAGGGIKNTELSNRYYLADSIFLVGLENAELALLQRIHAALRNPVWPLFLGRKAFVPGKPIWLEDGLKLGVALLEALDMRNYPYQGRPPIPERLRLVYEDMNGVIVRADQPLSFQTRRFTQRRLTITFISNPIPEVP